MRLRPGSPTTVCQSPIRMQSTGWAVHREECANAAGPAAPSHRLLPLCRPIMQTPSPKGPQTPTGEGANVGKQATRRRRGVRSRPAQRHRATGYASEAGGFSQLPHTFDCRLTGRVRAGIDRTLFWSGNTMQLLRDEYSFHFQFMPPQSQCGEQMARFLPGSRRLVALRAGCVPRRRQPTDSWCRGEAVQARPSQPGEEKVNRDEPPASAYDPRTAVLGFARVGIIVLEMAAFELLRPDARSRVPRCFATVPGLRPGCVRGFPGLK